ncbi:MAG TPA: hypothetical protein DDW52_21355 [Planctomycetaceae bacterium]|nr:hypothetical protein [Planctomycetaceae bacterium]
MNVKAILAFGFAALLSVSHCTGQQPDGGESKSRAPAQVRQKLERLKQEATRDTLLLDERRKIASKRQWVRVVRAPVDMQIEVIVSSETPKEIWLMTQSLFDAMQAGKSLDGRQSEFLLDARSTENELRRSAHLQEGSYVVVSQNLGNEETEFRLQCYLKSEKPTPNQLASDAHKFGPFVFRLPKRYYSANIPRPKTMPAKLEIGMWMADESEDGPATKLVVMSSPQEKESTRQTLANTLAGATDKMGIQVGFRGFTQPVKHSGLKVERVDFMGLDPGGAELGGAIFGVVHDERITTFFALTVEHRAEKVRSELGRWLSEIEIAHKDVDGK